MRYAKFGNTDMVVLEIALGTWGIGGAGWDDNSEDTRLDAIRSAVESGNKQIFCKFIGNHSTSTVWILCICRKRMRCG